MKKISRNTNIDELYRRGLIGQYTRDKCIDKHIFMVADLEEYLTYSGQLYIKGMPSNATYSLQKIWKMANTESDTDELTQNKTGHTNLIRILNAKEKDTVNELMSLFDSTFIEGNSVENTDAFIHIDSLKTPPQAGKSAGSIKNEVSDQEISLDDLFGISDSLNAPSNALDKYKQLNSYDSEFDERDFDANIDSFLDFVIQNKRYPEISNPGKEHNLRKWFKDVRTGKIVVSVKQKEQFDNMRDNVRHLITT